MIAYTGGKLGTLVSNIEDEEPSIENEIIVEAIVTILKDAFRFASDAKSQVLQVAGLVDLTTDMISGTFKEKLQNKAQRQRLISVLQRLEGSLRQLVNLLNRLQTSLPRTIEATQTLSNVWEYCYQHIEPAKMINTTLTDIDIERVVNAWNIAQESALGLQDAISGRGSKGMKALSFGIQALAESDTFPLTEAQVEAMDLLDQLNLGRCSSSAH